VFVDLEGDRTCRMATGEVTTRLRDRGCRGVIGAETDRRSAFRVAAVFTKSPSCEIGLLVGVGGVGWGFAASPNALRAALTTCVASVAFSLVDNPPCSPLPGFVLRASFGVALPRGSLEVFETRESSVVEVDIWSSLGRSKLLRRATVAGEHVATEAMALRTASAWEDSVSMKMSNALILNHIIANS
jgi:hypothetical protein